MAVVILAFMSGDMQTMKGGELQTVCLLKALEMDEYTGKYLGRKIDVETIDADGKRRTSV